MDAARRVRHTDASFPGLYPLLPSFDHHEPVTVAGAESRVPIQPAEACTNLFLVAGNSSRGRAPDSMFFKRSKVDKKIAAVAAAEPTAAQEGTVEAVETAAPAEVSP